MEGEEAQDGHVQRAAVYGHHCARYRAADANRAVAAKARIWALVSLPDGK